MNNDVDEGVEVTGPSSKQPFARGFSQIKPLFVPPLLQNILLVCLLQMLQMMRYEVKMIWFWYLIRYEQSGSLKTLGVVDTASRNKIQIKSCQEK